MPWQETPATVTPGGFVSVELAQTGPREFTLRADLVYRERPDNPDLAAGRVPPVHVVPAGFRTDLASVPYPLWSLIGPFGRHTRAAILHDHGVRSLRPPLRTPERLAEREAIDRRFRDALLDSGVPRLRAYLMWAGASMDRIVRNGSPLRAAALVLQLAAGLVLLVVGVRVGGWVGLGAFALPVLPALAWGRARLAVGLVQYVGALVLPVLVLGGATAGLLAAASVLVGGRAQGIAPTSLPPGPAGPSGPAEPPEPTGPAEPPGR